MIAAPLGLPIVLCVIDILKLSVRDSLCSLQTDGQQNEK